jgi:SMI1 / KNR4 family (SUKH-1)
MSPRELFPNGRFSSPATDEQIARVEAELSLRLPDQLRRMYFECDGFREDRGNAKYLLSLLDDDYIGSVVTVTRCMWTEFETPDLRPFVFFGCASGGETWGISPQRPDQIIAYHHHMEGEYEVVGSDIADVWRDDYAKYGGDGDE